MTNHPIASLRQWLNEEYPDSTLEFSRYVYKHYGRTESREIFHLECKAINFTWLKHEFRRLADSQELAFHSRVKLANGQTRHIPMIDFTNVLSPETASSRTRYISDLLGVSVELYSSGNSLHGYYLTLISQNDWLDFLASLLLCNLPDQIAEDVIDTRWVGHALKHRFCALRWSKHTNSYKQIPSKVHQAHQQHGIRIFS